MINDTIQDVYIDMVGYFYPEKNILNEMRNT